ncbi:MAG: hypothetical protein AAGE94_00810 [Acidobacteriota bacterium]
MIHALVRWFRRTLPDEPTQVLTLSPSCSSCGMSTAMVHLVERTDGWRLVFQGVAGSGNGTGDPITVEQVQRIRAALTPPYESAAIQAAGTHDDFGFCTDCEAFYCATHWQVSTTGGGTCPAGHFKSLDPHWHPDWDD